MQGFKFAKFSDAQSCAHLVPQENTSSTRQDHITRAGNAAGCVKSGPTEDELNVFWAQFEKPCTTNLDLIRIAMSLTKLRYIQGKQLLESDAWKRWQVMVREDIEITLPPLIAAENHAVSDMLLKHTDSMEIQATVLSMVWQHVRGSGSHGFALRLHEDLLSDDKCGLIGVLCKIVVSANVNLLCRDNVYVNTIWFLKYIWTQLCLVSHGTGYEEPRVRFAELLISTSLQTLQHIYEAQHDRVSLTQYYDDVDADRREQNLRNREFAVQKPILEMVGKVLESMRAMYASPLYESGMQSLVRKYCLQLMRVFHLTQYSDARTTDSNAFAHWSVYVFDRFRMLYESIYGPNSDYNGRHNKLGQGYSALETLLLTRLFDEPQRSTDCSFLETGFDVLLSLYRSRRTLALQATPCVARIIFALVQQMHNHPTNTFVHMDNLNFMSQLQIVCNQYEGRISPIIVKELVRKVHGMDFFDMLIGVQTDTTRNIDDQNLENIYESVQSLLYVTLSDTSAENRTTQSMLMESRMFDMYVLKLFMSIRECEMGDYITPVTECGLKMVLRLLKIRPYQIGRGFIHIVLTTQSTGYHSHVAPHTSSYYAEFPHGQCKLCIGPRLQNSICRNYCPRDCVAVNQSATAHNIATVLSRIQHCILSSQEVNSLICRILPLLVRPMKNKQCQLGNEWMEYCSAPDDMFNPENDSANRNLADALAKNPLLYNGLAQGRLKYNELDWAEFRKQTNLFSPVDSIACQRGVSNRGTVEIQNKFFRPIALPTMQSALELCSVDLVCVQIQSILFEHGRPNASMQSEIYGGLVFVECMLDEVMDIRHMHGSGNNLVILLDRVLGHAGLGVQVHSKACHVLKQVTQKIDIPVFDIIPSAATGTLFQRLLMLKANSYSTHLAELSRMDPIFTTIANSKLPQSLFAVVGSVSQETEEDRFYMFNACVVLIDIFKIKATKFPATTHKNVVSVALSTAHRNIGTASGISSYTKLFQTLLDLNPCCDKPEHTHTT